MAVLLRRARARAPRGAPSPTPVALRGGENEAAATEKEYADGGRQPRRALTAREVENGSEAVPKATRQEATAASAWRRSEKDGDPIAKATAALHLIYGSGPRRALEVGRDGASASRRDCSEQVHTRTPEFSQRGLRQDRRVL